MSITPSTVAKQLRSFMEAVEDQVSNRKWSLDLDIDNGFSIEAELEEDEEFDDDIFDILEYDSNPVVYRKDDVYDILWAADDDLVSFIVKIYDEDVDMDDFPELVAKQLGIEMNTNDSDEDSE